MAIADTEEENYYLSQRGIQKGCPTYQASKNTDGCTRGPSKTPRVSGPTSPKTFTGSVRLRMSSLNTISTFPTDPSTSSGWRAQSTNMCYNVLDRIIDNGHGERIAYHWSVFYSKFVA